jgi:hypothetical protein
MLAVVAYPASFETTGNSTSHLAELDQCISALLSDRAALHLLPFCPNDGDGGFAPSDWCAVDERLGDWSDVRRIAAKRRLVVDGIYNHVGVSHTIARKFFEAPAEFRHLVYAFEGSEEIPVQSRSPRGGTPLRVYVLAEQTWHLWQTFGRAAVDVRLDDDSVRAEVIRNLDHLVSLGVWAVRLDAAAYYAKPVRHGEQQLHHPDAHRLAREIALLAISRGLVAIAQLDCDENGAGYFPPENYQVPIVDYSYSAHLALALLTSDASELIEHLEITAGLGRILIRAPRTHDGILLRSGLLGGPARSLLVRRAAAVGIKARIVDGEAYELNCSLPHLCGRDTDQEGRHRRLLIAVAISAFVPGWCFLYLPMLLDYEPELYRAADADPRSLNRTMMPGGYWRRVLATDYGASMHCLLGYLASIHGTAVTGDEADVEPAVGQDGRVLVLDRTRVRLRLVANMDPHEEIDVSRFVRGALERGWHASERRLGRLGFGFWRY